MQVRYFEDVDVGDEFDEHEAPGRDDVLRFFTMTAGASTVGQVDPDGRFASAEAAKRLGAEGPIVPGVMSFAMLSRLVTGWAGAQGQMQTLDISFRRMIAHGDKLRLLGLVTDTDAAAGTVKLDVFMENEKGERPLQGTAVVQLPHKG